MSRFSLSVLCPSVLLLCSVVAGAQQRLVINEIMYAPSSGKPEWVELYNPTAEPVDVQGWLLYDATSARPVIATVSAVVPPSSYLVVAADSGILTDFPAVASVLLVMSKLPSLNNTGDDITLARADSSVVETVSYKTSWGGSGGRSLERIKADGEANDAANWSSSTSAALATPGQENSVSGQPLPAGALAVNEIMFDPLSDEAEWVEFVNTGTTPAGVRGFHIADQPGTGGARSTLLLTGDAVSVAPGGFLVVASDTSILARYPSLRARDSSVVLLALGRSSLNLNNDADEVVLLDPRATTPVDSVRYNASWHNPALASTTGRSLERLNPAFPAVQSSSWSSCSLDIGGTPGRKNSIFTELPPQLAGDEAQLTVQPNPFSPDNDGFEDVCVVGYRLPAAVNVMRLRAYDSQGRLLRTIANGVPAGRSGQAVWDGRDDAGNRVRIGMVILLLEAVDQHDAVVSAAKTVVVVATRL